MLTAACDGDRFGPCSDSGKNEFQQGRWPDSRAACARTGLVAASRHSSDGMGTASRWQYPPPHQVRSRTGRGPVHTAWWSRELSASCLPLSAEACSSWPHVSCGCCSVAGRSDRRACGPGRPRAPHPMGSQRPAAHRAGICPPEPSVVTRDGRLVPLKSRDERVRRGFMSKPT